MATFPGVYPALSKQVNGSSVDAYVPQVFGELQIKISAYIGSLPAASEMGWVAFQGGNPEFPVWIGAGVVGVPGTGGGDSGGGDSGGGGNGDGGVVVGFDEVFIGSHDPGIGSTHELWVAVDAPAILTDQRWNTAWGVVKEASVTTPQTGIVGTVVDLTNLSLTFTPVVGRRYVYRAKADVLSSVAADVPVMTITDAANVTLDRFTTSLSSTASETWAWATYSESFVTTTPVTRKLRMNRALGTGSIQLYATAANPAKFIVEDAGPVIGSLPAEPLPTSGLEAAKPIAPPTPMVQYFSTDTKRQWLWDGTGWIIMAEPWTSYAVTMTNVSFGSGGSVSGVHRRSDGMCDVHIICSLGTGSAGVLTTGPTWSLPFAESSTESSEALPGIVTLHDATGALHGLIPVQYSQRIEPRYLATGGGGVSALGQISNTYPITIAVNDYITLKLRYRMASRYS